MIHLPYRATQVKTKVRRLTYNRDGIDAELRMEDETEVDGTERKDAVDAVQRMQDHMLAHLHVPVTLQDLARAAGYSPYHASRMFGEITGTAPFDYLRSLRLTQAARRLRDEPVRVVDVAFDFDFGSHEGFTRAFAREFGLTPRDYAARKPPLRWFLPYRVTDSHRWLKRNAEKDEMDEKEGRIMEEYRTVFVQAVDRPQRKALVKRGIAATDYYAYCEEVGCDVWGVLTSVKGALHEPCGMWLPEAMRRPGTSEYVQGVEVPSDYSGEVPDGFELMDLPPCRLLVFQGPPFKDEEFEEAIGAMWSTIEKYQPSLFGFRWVDEDGPRIQLEPLGYRGYIEARPVRSVN
jgi:AraC-like DNA-binding protein